MKPKKLALLIALSLASAPFICWAASDAEVEELMASTRLLKRRLEEQQLTIRGMEQRIRELEQHASSNILSETRGRGTPSTNTSLSQAIAQLNNGAAPQVTSQEAQTPVKDAQAPVQDAPAPAQDAQAQNAQTAPAMQPTQPTVTTGVQPGSVQAQAITSTQGIPLFDRKFSLEQGLTYTHFDKRNLTLSGFLALDSIFLGRINLRQTKTDQIQYDITGRWNLTDRLSVDVNLPLIYRTAKIFSPGASGTDSLNDGSSNTAAFGDLNAGVYYHFIKESSKTPDWIGSLRIKAPTGKDPYGIKLVSGADPDSPLLVPDRQPTGNGVWSTTFGLTAIKTFDPVVLFANVGYTHNFKRSFSDLSAVAGTVTPGDVKLGDAFSYGAGFALALNDRTSVSFSFANTIQKAASLRGREAGVWVKQVGSDSNAATFNAGLTHQISKNLTMAGNLSIGLTPDAPDFSFGIKFPYSF